MAVGVPNEKIDSTFPGAVNIIYGSQGSGLTAIGNQAWHQDSPGILDAEETGAESGDTFGTSVTAGDFNNDGIEDLAIGVPAETIINKILAGAINIIYGSQGSGLTALGNEAWDQNSPGILDDAETPDRFGGHVTAGDFDGDGFDDLTIGVQI